MTAGGERVYLEGVRSWRRVSHLLLGLFWSALGVFVLIAAVTHPPAGAAWWQLAGLVIWLVFWLGLGALLLYRYAAGLRETVRIDDAGITVGETHWPWESIARIFVRRPGLLQRGNVLVFQLKGVGLDRGIVTDAPLDDERCDRLLMELEEDLAERYPGLTIG